MFYIKYHKFIFVFFSIFLNQLITAVVSFHGCSYNLFYNSSLMLSRITCLLFLFHFLLDWWVLLLHYFQNLVCGFLMLWNTLLCCWLGFCQGCFSYWLFFLPCSLLVLVKISYSCMENIKSVIIMHRKENRSSKIQLYK